MRITRGRRGLALAAAGLAVLTAAGCGTPITSGTIIGRDYEPAYTSIYLQPNYTEICTPSASGGSTCTSELAGFTPIPIYHPESWELLIRPDHADGGKRKPGWVDTDAYGYDHAQIGAHWSKGTGQ